MKTNYLFPHKWKIISGILFLISFVLLTVYFILNDHPENPLGYTTTVFALFDDSGFDGPTVFFGLTKTCITDEVLVLFTIVSGLIFAFSKEKHEDEMVASIRLQSLAIATIANYLIILFCYTFIFGFLFFNVMMAALFSQLLIFIVLFRFKMYRFYNTRQDEE